jgi:electron transfer flavoprotein beta subunit
MHIIVLLKQVHDPNTPRASLRIGTDGRSLALPAGANPILNGYDANALEEALRIKDKLGGTVTAISLGSDSAKEALRRAIAMGADKALHVADEAGIAADSEITAAQLAAAIRTSGEFGLILAGRSASDTDGGVVALLIAGHLGIPAVTPVKTLTVDADGTIIVERLTDSGSRRLRITGAAVVGVSNEANKPRTPQLRGVAAAKRATIPTLTATELHLRKPEASLRLERLFIPEERRAATELISAESPAQAGRALADRLRAEGLI